MELEVFLEEEFVPKTLVRLKMASPVNWGAVTEFVNFIMSTKEEEAGVGKSSC